MMIEKHVMGENAAIAYHLEKFDTIGIDCVARCVNAIIAKGAIPTNFVAEIPDAFVEHLMPGFVEGCILGCCSLEVKTTAKSTVTGIATGMYDMREERGRIRDGDRLIGLLSSGFHDEGLVKAAQILELDDENIRELIPDMFCKMEDELFRPAKIYARPMLYLTRTLGIKLNAVCSVGENGLVNKIGEMLPEGIKAKLLPEDFPMSGLYEVISRESNMTGREMFENFNMGIGLVMAVDREKAGEVMSSLIQIGEHPYVIGCCVEGDKTVELNW
jgi:phosphoribosylformylglycinamidine cyclo-ligase